MNTARVWIPWRQSQHCSPFAIVPNSPISPPTLKAFTVNNGPATRNPQLTTLNQLPCFLLLPLLLLKRCPRPPPSSCRCCCSVHLWSPSQIFMPTCTAGAVYTPSPPPAGGVLLLLLLVAAVAAGLLLSSRCPFLAHCCSRELPAAILVAAADTVWWFRRRGGPYLSRAKTVAIGAAT